MRGRSFLAKLTTSVFQPSVGKNTQDVDIHIHQADDLYRWQLSQVQPRALNELSCFMASIIDSKTFSGDVYRALVRIGVLHRLTGELDLGKIDRNFSHYVSMVTLERQRKVIGLLFHWEEELSRLRLLDQEEQEIRLAMEVIGEDDEDCQIGLRVIERKRRMLPSERLQSADACALPGYSSSTIKQPPAPRGLPTDTLAAWPSVDTSNIDHNYARSLR